MSIMDTVLKIARKVKWLVFGQAKPTWKQIEYFNPEWKNRIRVMSQYIRRNDSVLDLGCGQMWLKEFLLPSNQYTGVDYQQRDSETIVCDFNRCEFPNVSADVFFVSGCLEYIHDFESFIENIANSCRRCIISYCCMDEFSDIQMRRQRAWVNDLTREQLLEMFFSKGMRLTCEDKTLTNNAIFIFDNKGEGIDG
jgi:SAM-dependent methyltransferase